MNSDLNPADAGQAVQVSDTTDDDKEYGCWLKN